MASKDQPLFKKRDKTDQRFTTDLFKLKVAKMVKNVNYKKYEPKFEEVEHCHFFHTTTSRGRQNKYASFVGGHTHEMKVEKDQMGNILKVTLGPPIHEVELRGKGGMVKKSMQTIQYEDQFGGLIRKDDHTHEIEYKFSEEISPRILKGNAQSDAEMLAKFDQAANLQKISAKPVSGFEDVSTE